MGPLALVRALSDQPQALALYLGFIVSHDPHRKLKLHLIEGEGLGLVTQNILSVSLNTPLTPHPNFRAV